MNGKILEEIREGGFRLAPLARVCPELLEMKDVPQNPDYHGEGDVYRHTEMVCGALVELPGWRELGAEQRELLFLAAAFHDIGKTVCTKLEDGHWVSPRHTIAGEKMFRSLVYREAERFGLDFGQRELAAKLVRYHGLPVWFWAKERPEYELLKAAESVPLGMLYLLSKADTLGRAEAVPGRLTEQVELFAEYAAELGVWEKPFAFANPYTRYQYYHKEDLWQGAKLYDDTSFDVIMMAGLPLAGKDSWIARNGGNLPVVSLDDLREEMGISPAENSGRVVQAAVERAKGFLRRRQPFIWNATNLIEETRQKLAGLFTGYGARVHVRYLEVPYRELLARNRVRERHIPEAVLERMIRKLEVPGAWEAYEVNTTETELE